LNAPARRRKASIYVGLKVFTDSKTPGARFETGVRHRR
jgi:hypothetical protein